MSFQKQVNLVQAPGVLGDFASMNPFSSVLSGPGALIAPAGGVRVGGFAWVNPANNAVSQSYVAGYQIGFNLRNENALITNFLGESSLLIPQGFMVNLLNGGDFWAYFGNGAVSGSTVYADQSTGAATTAAGTSVTGSIGFTGTASFAANVLTVVTQTAGSLIEVGDVVTSAGVTAGTTVTAQLTGLPGAVGSTYSLSTTPGTIATQAATTASATLNVSAVATGSLSVGDPVTGTGITAGTTIGSFGTGLGGVGTYNLIIPGGTPINTASETVTGSTNIATAFTVRGATLVGAGIAKISASVS